MSGHSKWSTIKRKKEKTDAQRAKIFTKIGREMTVCVKQSGPDPSSNTKLKDLIIKAKANNVPSDNIERVIKKAAGGDDKNTYEEITYEGYGPSGVAILVKTLTDNRNRTAADLRHYFDKYGGNMGSIGCVSFMFNEKGIIIIDKEKANEDQLMELALEAGASDFSSDNDCYEISTEVADFHTVRDALENAGYELESAEIDFIADNYVSLDEQSIVKMEKLLDMFDDNDDVQDVYHNWEN
ncbi:MAG: YebC/PmpR family DNA-binding transcriptional regulator [Oscillospiraceae bacterium]